MLRITAAKLHRYRLPLRAAWATAAGGFTVREGWLLRLETADGGCAYGDCAPLPASGTETLAEAATALQTYLGHPNNLVGRQVEDVLAALANPAIGRTPAARCAVETALLDLLAQAAGQPLAEYLCGKRCKDQVRVNAALGSLMQCSRQALLAAHAAGFSVVKLKVGTAPVAEEISHLRAIAAHAPDGLQLRLDANRAWRAAQAAEFLAACAGLPIEMLEEPLADPDPAALRRLQAACAFPLAIDESWRNFDADCYFASPPVRRLVIKPPTLGGLLPALAIARRANAAGLECVVTSSVESACGVLAAAHLAAALEQDLAKGLASGLASGLAHGLATSSWLAEDNGLAPKIAGGLLNLPIINGLGFTPRPEIGFV